MKNWPILLRWGLAFVLCLVALWQGLFFVDLIKREAANSLGYYDWPIFVDYSQRFILSGKLYDDNLALYGPAAAIYKFPPLFASILVWLMQLGVSADVLKSASGVLHVGIFFGSVIACVTFFKHDKWMILFPAAAIFAFSFGPMIDCYERLQPEIYILLLVCLSMHCLTRRRLFLSGLCMGFAAALKIYPLFFVLYFILERQRLALAGVFAGLVLATAFTLYTIGYGEHVFYITYVVPELLKENLFVSIENVSIGSLLVHQGFSMSVAEVACKGVLVLVVLFMSSGYVYRAITKSPAPDGCGAEQVITGFSVLVAAFVLGSNNAWWHYQLLLVVPVVSLFGLALARKHLDMASLCMLVLACLMIVATYWGRLQALSSWSQAIWPTNPLSTLLLSDLLFLRVCASLVILWVAIRMRWRVMRIR